MHLAFFFLVAGAHGCGFTVHQLNSHRSISSLSSTPQTPELTTIIRENLGAMYAGSPYPDYLYACGPNHDNGEYTHWSPFQAIASRYISQTYPAPRNGTAQALVAFLAGVASHYMADISWHGLAETPHGYGLIETIGGFDFNTTGELAGDAHTEADTAGEFVAAYDNVLPWDDPAQWVIPINDLLAIYKMANRSDVTAGAIEECAAIFFAGAEAVKAAAALAEPIEESKSPTLGEYMEDMLVGGIDDMAVMLGRTWGRLGTWLERGPPTPVPGNEYCTPQNPCRTPPSSTSTTNSTTSIPSKRWAALRASLASTQEVMRVVGRVVRSAGLVVEGRDESKGGAFTLHRSPHSTPHKILTTIAQALLLNPGLSSEKPNAATAVGANGGWTYPRPSDSHRGTVEGHLTALFGAPWVSRVKEGGDVMPPPKPPTAPTSASNTNENTQGKLQAPPAPALPTYIGASITPREYFGGAITSGDYDGNGFLDFIATAYGASPVGVYEDDALGLAAAAAAASAVTTTTSGVASGSAAAVLPQAGGYYARYTRRNGTLAVAVGGTSGGSLGASPIPEAIVPTDRTTGSSVYSRLGSSACSLDFNLDGVDDLVSPERECVDYSHFTASLFGGSIPIIFHHHHHHPPLLFTHSTPSALPSLHKQVLGAPSAGWAWNHDAWDETPLFYYQGRVEVYFGVAGVGLPTSPTTSPSALLLPTSNLTFLGATLLCDTDLNGDGAPDLVIGSPQYDSTPTGGSVQAGRLDVFYAGKAWGIASIAPTTRVTATVGGANVSIIGGGIYEWLGFSLAGWGNASSLGGGESGGGVAGVEKWVIDAALALPVPPKHLSVTSASDCTQLAATLAASSHTILPTSALLLVGSPGYRRVDPGQGFASVGSVKGFLLPSPTTPLHTYLTTCTSSGGGGVSAAAALPLFTLQGERGVNGGRLGATITSKLGASVAIGTPLGWATTPMIALSAPALDLCGSAALIPSSNGTSLFPTAAGAVVLLPLSSALIGTLEWATLVGNPGNSSTTANPYGTRALLASRLPDARFGWRVQWSPLTRGASPSTFSDLVVAAPQFTSLFIGSSRSSGGGSSSGGGGGSGGGFTLPEGDSGRELGAVFVYKGGSDGALPKGALCAAEDSADWWASGPVEHGRLGSSLGVGDWDGDGNLEFLVGAPKAGVVIPPSVGGKARVGDDPNELGVEFAGAVLAFSLPLV